MGEICAGVSVGMMGPQYVAVANIICGVGFGFLGVLVAGTLLFAISKWAIRRLRSGPAPEQ